jgi:hypothetical protein
MMRLIRRLVLLGLFVALVVVGGAYTLPDSARIERHVVIAATPAQVFRLVGDLRQQAAWSPWAGADPRVKAAISGPEGVGQKLTWESADPSLGRGALTVTARDPDLSIAMDMDLPDYPGARMWITLAQLDNGTGLTWGMAAPVVGIKSRWVTFFTFENRVSPNIVEGLAKLKRLAEVNG